MGRLEWSYAPRFLAIALKYPQDPVAIDALGGLVASQFTPPEADQAAEILIRDHLESDKLIPIYYQLVHIVVPGSVVGRRAAPPRRRGKGPDARRSRPGML